MPLVPQATVSQAMPQAPQEAPQEAPQKPPPIPPAIPTAAPPVAPIATPPATLIAAPTTPPGPQSSNYNRLLWLREQQLQQLYIYILPEPAVTSIE